MHSFDNNKRIIKALCIADDIWIQIDRIEPLQPVAQTCRQSHAGAPTAASQLLINTCTPETFSFRFFFCVSHAVFLRSKGAAALTLRSTNLSFLFYHTVAIM